MTDSEEIRGSSRSLEEIHRRIGKAIVYSILEGIFIFHSFQKLLQFRSSSQTFFTFRQVSYQIITILRCLNMLSRYRISIESIFLQEKSLLDEVDRFSRCPPSSFEIFHISFSYSFLDTCCSCISIDMLIQFEWKWRNDNMFRSLGKYRFFKIMDNSSNCICIATYISTIEKGSTYLTMTVRSWLKSNWASSFLKDNLNRTVRDS